MAKDERAEGSPAAARERPYAIPMVREVSSAADERVQTPLAWDPLELGDAVLLEIEPRPHHQIPDRARDKHLAGTGPGPHPCPDVHGHPGEVAIAALTFAGYPYRVDFTTCAKLNCQRSTMWNPIRSGT